MCKIFITPVVILLACLSANGQHKVYFEPKLSPVKVKNSLYNRIHLLDSRADTSLGVVQTGAFNRKAKSENNN